MRTRAIVLTVGTAFLCSLTSMGQPLIDYAEWFVDTDPGFGNGVSIDIGGPTQNLKISENINLDAFEPLLSEGVHHLVVRVKDDAENWSVALNRPFMVYNGADLLPTPKVTRLEYFIDSDPEPGNGNVIEFANQEAISIEEIVSDLDLENLDDGQHWFSCRILDEYGNWSIAQTRGFNKYTPSKLEDPDLKQVILQWYVDGSEFGDPIVLEPEGNNGPVKSASFDEILSMALFKGGESAVLKVTPIDSKAADYAIPEIGVSSFASIQIEWRDSDGDGLPDQWEELFGFDKDTPIAEELDTDGDGTLDKDEFVFGTNPLSVDTDADGLSDSAEILLEKYGFDPIGENRNTITALFDAAAGAGLYRDSEIGSIRFGLRFDGEISQSGENLLRIRLRQSGGLEDGVWVPSGIDDKASVSTADGNLIINLPSLSGQNSVYRVFTE